MRGNPITGAARGVSITDAVERGQRILEDRPEPRGRERYAGRSNRPPRPAARPAEGEDAQTGEPAQATTNGEED
ncbi:MAG: hypothetical protein ACFE0R_05040 [Salinarimonas sp.]